MRGYCKGVRVRAFSICEYSNKQLEEIKEFFEELGADNTSYSYIVNLAIEFLYKMLKTGNIEHTDNMKIVINNPNVILNNVKAEANTNTNIDLESLIKFLENLVNPPDYLLKPHPWIRADAKKLLEQLRGVVN